MSVLAAISGSGSGGTSSIIPFLAVSVVCGLLIGGVVMILLSRQGDVSRRVGGFISTSRARSQATRSLVERALGDKQARAIGRSPYWDKLRVELEVADVKLSLERLLGVVFIGMVFAGWLLERTTASYIGMLLGAVAVPVAARIGLKTAADRQRRRFSEQLPDNLQVVASAMRAGQTFVGSLSAVVDDAPEPSKRELRRAITDEALGVPLSEALGQVTERMNSTDFQQVSIVAGLQRDTGGNTAEVIDLVADVIRDRIELRRMVRALTAQGRLAGVVLSGLPVGLLLIISMINPGYTHPLFHTTAGLVSLSIGVVLTVIGSWLINKIVDIDV